MPKMRSVLSSLDSERRLLRGVWGGAGGISDENLDKLKYIERKCGMSEGFIPQAHIDALVKNL